MADGIISCYFIPAIFFILRKAKKIPFYDIDFVLLEV